METAIEEEIWGSVANLPNISGSSEGRVRDDARNVILKNGPRGRGYLHVGIKSGNKTVFHRVHRIIADALLPNPLNLPEVDHINHDNQDNRLANLRRCTRADNLANTRKRLHTSGVNSSSKFKGVCWLNDNDKWMAQIRVEGKMKLLGHYQLEEHAATAYDRAALLKSGEFAATNVRLGLLVDRPEYQTAVDEWETHKIVKTSAFKGVSKEPSKKKWRTSISVKGKSLHIGFFEVESVASMYRDRIKERLKTLPIEWDRAQTIAALQELLPVTVSTKSSKFPGVSFNKTQNTWHASIRVDGKQKYLGYFPADQEKEAAECVEQAKKKMRLNDRALE